MSPLEGNPRHGRARRRQVKRDVLLHGYLVYKILSPKAIIVIGYDGFRVWKTGKNKKRESVFYSRLITHAFS